MSSVEFFLDFEYFVILHINNIALLSIFVVNEDICLLMK